MNVAMTEYLAIDLQNEKWCCRKCNHALAPARGNYKEGLLVHVRDPRDIHRPIIDDTRYDFTFAPDPKWVQIIEYYCPECAAQVEVEYLPPGHPPLYDMQFDIDALKERYLGKSKGDVR